MSEIISNVGGRANTLGAMYTVDSLSGENSGDLSDRRSGTSSGQLSEEVKSITDDSASDSDLKVWNSSN